jgi:methylenetetrahydrofolate dehydrogenase (NADP+) / methenyltetrahydrofolate cyclohydrolase
MRIDGKQIAGDILHEVKQKARALTASGVVPTLAVLLVGDDQASLSYIKQKQKAAETSGIRLLFEHLPQKTSIETLRSAIAHFNADTTVHGCIIQRPVPIISNELSDVLHSVEPKKDVDGFLPMSLFAVPVAKAVITLLSHVHQQLGSL